VFNPSSNAQHIVERGKNADTPLLAFFKANQLLDATGQLAWTLTYQEFPEQFVLKSLKHNPQSKTWHLQHSGFAVG